MVDAGTPAPRPAVAPPRAPLLLGAHLLAAGVVVVGVAVQVVRPLAPDLGPPPQPAQWFDAAHLEQVAAYRGPLYVAGVAGLALRLATPCLVAFTSTGRRVTDRIVATVGQHRPARAAAAVVVAVVVATDLILLPLVAWASFVHDGAFGFRTQGLAGWVFDWAVATVPAWLVVAVLVVGAYALAGRLPRAWPPVAGLAAFALTALLVYAAPLVLEPLVFDTAPVPAGPVRAEVERVLDRAGQDIERIVVADASRRTTKRNAYVSGLGTSRRVVLYDTLIDNQAAEEVGVVMAHEVGHHQNADLARGTLFAGAGVVALVSVLAWTARRRTHAGRQRAVTDPRAAAVMLAVVVLLNALSVPVQNAASRRAEAAADLAALRITGDPATYLRMTERLARANLTDPLPPRWAQHLWSSHPPTTARLEMGRRWIDGELQG